MDDPMANDPRMLLALRYIELPPRLMASATARCLERLGKFEQNMEPRVLDEREIMMLAEEDFRDGPQ